MDRSRLEAFSDGVFAVAITLLALDLTVAGPAGPGSLTDQLHEMAKQQLEILNGQDRVLSMLDTFASKDLPGRQRHMQNCVDQILAKVDPAAAGS